LDQEVFPKLTVGNFDLAAFSTSQGGAVHFMPNTSDEVVQNPDISGIFPSCCWFASSEAQTNIPARLKTEEDVLWNSVV
jgi:hypothetical protein